MSRDSERGASFWSLLVCLVLVGFLVFLAFEIAPPYFANWQIEKALANVAKQPGADSFGRSALRSAVRREFAVGYISHVSVAKDLHFRRTAHGLRVMVFRYEVRVPIMANVTALIAFVDRRKVTGS